MEVTAGVTAGVEGAEVPGNRNPFSEIVAVRKTSAFVDVVVVVVVVVGGGRDQRLYYRVPRKLTKTRSDPHHRVKPRLKPHEDQFVEEKISRMRKKEKLLHWQAYRN